MVECTYYSYCEKCSLIEENTHNDIHAGSYIYVIVTYTYMISLLLHESKEQVLINS